MEGKRFSNRSIPLCILQDVSVLNKIVMDVASVIYLEKNPERKRVRRGFRDDYFLSMSAITPGSAVAEIRIEKTMPQKTLVETEEEKCVYEAYDIVSEYLGGNMDVEVNERYVSKIGPHLNAFGGGLKEGERFLIGRDGKMYTYDTEVRRKLIGEDAEHLEMFEIYGTVSEIDCDTRSFKVTYGGYSKPLRMTFPFSESASGSLVKGALNRGKVFVKAVGRFKGKKLSKVEQVEEFAILDTLDIQARLYEMQFIEPGWAEGGGVAFDKNALNDFAALLDTFVYWPSETLPRIFPTPEGNLEFEWGCGGIDLIMEVGLENLTGTLFVFTEPPREIKLDFKKPDDWAKLMEYVGGEHGNQ